MLTVKLNLFHSTGTGIAQAMGGEIKKQTRVNAKKTNSFIKENHP